MSVPKDAIEDLVRFPLPLLATLVVLPDELLASVQRESNFNFRDKNEYFFLSILCFETRTIFFFNFILVF